MEPDPYLSYAGRMSLDAFRHLGNAIRILMQDHGVFRSDEMHSAALEELDVDAGASQPVWVFDNVIARKKSV
jgi:hypothetical protein